MGSETALRYTSPRIYVIIGSMYIVIQYIHMQSTHILRNAGILGGKFLERTRVAKPGSSTDKPEFYRPQDFAIGARIEVFKHKFIITDVDEYVLKYMEAHAEEFPVETLNSLRRKHGKLPPEHTTARDKA